MTIAPCRGEIETAGEFFDALGDSRVTASKRIKRAHLYTPAGFIADILLRANVEDALEGRARRVTVAEAAPRNELARDWVLRVARLCAAARGP